MSGLRRLHVFDKRIRKLCLVAFIVLTLVVFARNVNQLLTPSSDGGKWNHSDNYVTSDELTIIEPQHHPAFKATSVKGLLTIGISSVYRGKGDYLVETLESIVSASTSDERQGVRVIVCLSDDDRGRRRRTQHHLTRLFRAHVDSGFLLVIETSPKIYPDLTNLTSTFGDSAERMSWRAKQAIDFSYLFHVSTHVSQYYMILEDDIQCLQGFLTEIRSTIRRLEGKKWLKINFSNFLIIGTLFESSFLEGISQFIRLFYASQPVDFLILRYFDILAPGNDKRDYFIQRIPSLFQHIGYWSSLKDKVQQLKDNTFPGDYPQLYVTNPSAQVFTTIHTYDQYKPHLAYTSNLSFFWGIPRQGDTYDIVFQQPIKLSRVVIVTGLQVTMDILQHGILLSSPRFVRLATQNTAHCHTFRAVAKFTQGVVNATQFQTPLVQCLRVLVSRAQNHWLIIRRIAVFI